MFRDPFYIHNTYILLRHIHQTFKSSFMSHTRAYLKLKSHLKTILSFFIFANLLLAKVFDLLLFSSSLEKENVQVLLRQGLFVILTAYNYVFSSVQVYVSKNI